MSTEFYAGRLLVTGMDIQCLGNESTVTDCSISTKRCGWRTRLTCKKGIEQ